MQSTSKMIQDQMIEREIKILATLHPTYSREELRECRDNLVHYFDFVWEIFLKMREDGRLATLFDKDDS